MTAETILATLVILLLVLAATYYWLFLRSQRNCLRLLDMTAEQRAIIDELAQTIDRQQEVLTQLHRVIERRSLTLLLRLPEHQAAGIDPLRMN